LGGGQPIGSFSRRKKRGWGGCGEGRGGETVAGVCFDKGRAGVSLPHWHLSKGVSPLLLTLSPAPGRVSFARHLLLWRALFLVPKAVCPEASRPNSNKTKGARF